MEPWRGDLKRSIENSVRPDTSPHTWQYLPVSITSIALRSVPSADYEFLNED
jgi:hypothetical protein